MIENCGKLNSKVFNSGPNLNMTGLSQIIKLSNAKQKIKKWPNEIMIGVHFDGDARIEKV